MTMFVAVTHRPTESRAISGRSKLYFRFDMNKYYNAYC